MTDKTFSMEIFQMTSIKLDQIDLGTRELEGNECSAIAGGISVAGLAKAFTGLATTFTGLDQVGKAFSGNTPQAPAPNSGGGTAPTANPNEPLRQLKLQQIAAR